MTYWTRKNGRVEGPFPSEQVRRRINLNLLASLDEVSTDCRHWARLRDTELWNPVRTVPEEVELPAEPPPARLKRRAPLRRQAPSAMDVEEVGLDEATAASAAESRQTQPPPVAASPAAPGGSRKALVVAVCCAAGLLLALLVAVVALASSSRGDAVAEKTESVAAEVGFRDVQDKLAIVECKEGSGSGFLLEMDGRTYLVSNDHVFRSSEAPRIRMLDGTELSLGAFSVAADGRDLARFEVHGLSREPLQLNAEMPSVGDAVAVYGNSLGEGVATASKGFVQGVGPDRLETNAEIVSGNSGGPVVDAGGKVLGVAALLVRGDSGTRDWTLRNTRYDGNTRRFAVRLNGVTWKTVDRRKYERQVEALAELDAFWDHLRPFLVFDSGRVDVEKLYLDYTDSDSRDFKRSDHGFDEMMKAVVKARRKAVKAYGGWNGYANGRKKLVEGLNRDIESEKITHEQGERILSKYDAEEAEKYKAFKSAERGLVNVRKEALAMMRQYVDGIGRDVPQIDVGYHGDGSGDSVEWYRGAMRWGEDLMNQRLKDLNKAIREVEGNGDED